MKTPEQVEFWEAREIECKDTNEKVIGYKEYLKTKHWKNKRIEIYRKYNRHCTKCNKGVAMSQANVHHLTYERVGNELDEDLTLLCKDCHKLTHNLKVKPKKTWKDKNYKTKRKLKKEAQ